MRNNNMINEYIRSENMIYLYVSLACIIILLITLLIIILHRKKIYFHNNFLYVIDSYLIVIDLKGNIKETNIEFDIFITNNFFTKYNNFFFYFDDENLKLFQNELFKGNQSTNKIKTKFLSKSKKELNILWTMYYDKKTSLVYVSGRDFSSENFINESLQQSEEKLRQQYKSIPSPTYTWQKVSDDFVLSDFNDIVYYETEGNAQKLIGISAKELLKDNMEIVEGMESCLEKKQTIIQKIKYYLNDIEEYRYYKVCFIYVSNDTVSVQMEDITMKKPSDTEIKE